MYATVQGVSRGREGNGQYRCPEVLTLFRWSIMGVSNKMFPFTDKKYCYFYVLFHLYLLAVPYLEKKTIETVRREGVGCLCYHSLPSL